MSKIKIKVDKKDVNEINKKIKLALKFYKNNEILKSYSIYKYLYKNYKIEDFFPELINLIMISKKQKLLKNNRLKFLLISNVINYGIKNIKNIKIKDKILSYQLKVLRDYNHHSNFLSFYQNLSEDKKKIPFMHYEYIHYLIETKKYDLANDELKNFLQQNSQLIKDDKYFYGISNFIIDKNMYPKIFDLVPNFKDIIRLDKTIKKINTKFSLIIVVTGNYEIFKKEILLFLQSLKKTTSNFLVHILIDNADKNQQAEICQKIDQIKIENYQIEFENINSNLFNDIEQKTFYANRRYLLANELLKKHKCTIFTTDADVIILKDIQIYIKENSFFDMSLTFKKTNRFVWNTLTCPYSIFIPTSNSFTFLDFFEKSIYFIIKNKKLVWATDQIVLYSTYIMAQRLSNVKIIDNSNNDYTNKNSFFYHTMHNRFMMN